MEFTIYILLMKFMNLLLIFMMIGVNFWPNIEEFIDKYLQLTIAHLDARAVLPRMQYSADKAVLLAYQCSLCIDIQIWLQ